MIGRGLPMVAFCIALCLATPRLLLGAGSTSIVATPGSPAHVPTNWPAGVGDLINDPMRTTGWHSWFSEWPNDVHQYAFDVNSVDEINSLIKKLASIKSDDLQIRLSPLKEPAALGWMTVLPEGNNIAIIFSIGDQSVVDAWYKHVRKPFGVMEFVAAPVAVPPTLTIFVQNKAVNLDDLKVPKGIHVTSGYVPTVFQRFNTTLEREQEKESASQSSGGAAKPPVEDLEPAAQAAVAKIEAFLMARNGASKR